MSKKIIEQKPSETAMFAALHRAVAYKEYGNQQFGPDDLAESFLPAHLKFFIKFKNIRVNTKRKFNKFLPGIHEYMIARTAWFDTIFLDALDKEIPQIVMLGAGYDSRAYRFTKFNRGTEIIELDIAATQDRKVKCLRKAQIDIPKNVVHVPINFNNESLKNVLENAGYKNNKKTLFIWEGVSYYLEPEAVDATLEFITHSSHYESIIAFDYGISMSEESINYYGVKKFFQAMKKNHANEGLLFAIDEGQAESFLGQRGLKMKSHLNSEEIERTYLLDTNGALLGQIIGHFRFVMASPEQ